MGFKACPVGRQGAEGPQGADARRVRVNTPAYYAMEKIVGSAIGAAPSATDKMANPIKTTEAHTPKTMSEGIRRSRVATGGYKTVGEKRVMSVSNRAAAVGISLVSGA
jgi:hypothetical protein